MGLLEVVLISLLCGWIGAVIGHRTDTTLQGFLLGFLLGPIGWIVAAMGPRSTPDIGSPR